MTSEVLDAFVGGPPGKSAIVPATLVEARLAIVIRAHVLAECCLRFDADIQNVQFEVFTAARVGVLTFVIRIDI